MLSCKLASAHLTKCPCLVKICILLLSLPRSQTTNFPLLFITATFLDDNSSLGEKQDRDLPRVPQLTLLLPSHAEVISVGPVLLEHLDPVIVGVGHDDFLLNSETKAVRRVELTLAWSQLTELAAETNDLSGLEPSGERLTVFALS